MAYQLLTEFHGELITKVHYEGKIGHFSKDPTCPANEQKKPTKNVCFRCRNTGHIYRYILLKITVKNLVFGFLFRFSCWQTRCRNILPRQLRHLVHQLRNLNKKLNIKSCLLFLIKYENFCPWVI